MRVRAVACILAVAMAVGLAVPAVAQNQRVAEAIAANLKASGSLSGYRVGVRYANGTAVLHGRVSSEEQKALAEIIAADTPGVARVTNELVVAESATQTLRQPTGVASGRVRRAAHEAATSATPSVPEAPARIPSSVFGSELSQPIARVAAKPATQNTQLASAPVSAGQPLPVGAQAGMVGPVAMHMGAPGSAPVAGYDNPYMPPYAWPSYAAYPNYAAVQYPQQYSASAWPYIGPFYPYPQVPLGWRKVTLEWKDGWWFLDFKPQRNCGKCWTFPPF